MIVEGFDFAKGRAEARRRAERMVANGLYSRFSLSEKERIDKAEVGRLGEVAFERWLRSIPIRYEVDEGGFEGRTSDEFDFRVNGKKIDVKVAKKTTLNDPNDRWRFGVPVEQDPASKDVVVIGWVDFEHERVGFYGWMPGTQVAGYRVVKKNSLTGARYLTPNHEFPWGDLNKDLRAMFLP